MSAQRRLDLAGLDAEAAQLDLLVRSPEEVQHPIGAPARQIPGAVHPAAGGPERVRDKSLGGQPAPPQIAARQAIARRCKALPPSPAVRVQVRRRARRPGYSRLAGRWAPRTANPRFLREIVTGNCVCFRWTVVILQPPMGRALKYAEIFIEGRLLRLADMEQSGGSSLFSLIASHMPSMIRLGTNSSLILCA